MITRELVDQINRLARKQRSVGLTDEEKEEQARLRQLYLQGIRDQVTDALNSMGLKPRQQHRNECSCPDCKGH